MAIVLFTGSACSENHKTEQRTELETYIWLEREAMFDTEVPDSEIHDLIAKGLQHDDPEIVLCSVGAMSKFIGIYKLRIEDGGEPVVEDRNLQDIPGLYDTLINMWNEGWKEAGGSMPEPTMPEDLVERFEARTGSISVSPAWIHLPMLLSYLYPGDEAVYEIIWNAIPFPVGGYRGGFPDGGWNDANNPLPLLSALFHGEFNNPKDQAFRIDILLNKKAIRRFSALAAKSLGDFRSVEGLEALASVLQEDHRKYGTPHIQIVEAMIKYEEQAAPYLLKMSSRLKNAEPFNSIERDLQIALKERLVHFKEKYVEEAALPTP
ncbi:MAG: hypothetical protein F4227_02630 [Gammaproteobacteria bacterium]|nr:hypothetical protein [Gammaproteobacteria bacterium]